MSVCRIVVKDEVWCNVSGLTSRDQDILVNKYAIPVKNAYFNPTVQLGAWDGKQKFFYPTGNTYNYLLPEIFEIVTGMGYDVDLIDQRTAVKRALRPATAEMFSQYTHQDSTDPVILAEHQIRCVNAALAEDNGLIIACTGAGKTLMTAAMCDSLTHAGLNTIVIVPSVDLIANTRDELAAVGVVTGEYSGERKDLNHRVVVSTWQSLKNTPLVMKQFTAVIVDETHGAKAAELKKLLVEYGVHIAYRYGMTGTLPDDKCEALTVHVALGPVREEVSAAELIEKGWLATLDIEVLELTEDLHPQYNQFLAELKAKKTFGPPPTYKEFVKTYFPDYQSEKAYLIDKQDRIEWIANYLDAMRQAEGNTFVLVTSIPFGKALAKLIPNATFVHGSDKSKIRKQVYSLFNEHDDLVVIGTVNIAAVGINIKRIFNLVLIDLGKSFIRTIQSIGRGLRRGRGKTHLHVKDITSNLKYSTKHTKDRMKFYTAASYPNKKVRVEY